MIMKLVLIAVVMLWTLPASAQESRIASDWRREREHIAENCSELAMKKLVSCAVTLATDYPFHVALGNLPPHNGFGLGLAFVERFTPSETWRINFSADAVRSPKSAWRAGAFASFTRTGVPLPKVVTGGVVTATNAIREYPVISAYVEHTALDRVLYFGPSSPSLPAAFAEDQTVAGASAVMPISGLLPSLGLSVSGAANVRAVRVQDGVSATEAPLTSAYGELSPLVNDRTQFVELVEAVHLRPSLFNGRARLAYDARLQQFHAADAHAFRRWTADLRHAFPIYRTVGSSGPVAGNGPNECFVGPSSASCPPVNFSRNATGTIGFRLLATSSTPSAGGSVPFYFQPTLGGTDINGESLLASFDDYRFRAPHLIALQASVEHSIWGPLGMYATLERGKVAQRRGDLDFNDLLASYSVGFSIRAGGLPVITGAWAWGDEGGRAVLRMDASLLGGSSRPRLQ